MLHLSKSSAMVKMMMKTFFPQHFPETHIYIPKLNSIFTFLIYLEVDKKEVEEKLFWQKTKISPRTQSFKTKQNGGEREEKKRYYTSLACFIFLKKFCLVLSSFFKKLNMTFFLFDFFSLVWLGLVWFFFSSLLSD